VTGRPPRTYGALCAEFYDRTKPVGADYPDVPYYLRRLADVAGPVLEGAAGTGRLLIPLCRAGVRVEGLDSSPPMLARCRRNCAEAGVEAALHLGALQTMDLPHRYQAVVVTFGSFMLLSGQGEAAAALERIRHHLVPGGWLFIDVDSAPGPSSAPGRESRRAVAAAEGSLIVLLDACFGWDATGRVEAHVQHYEQWRDGRVVARESLDFSLRRYERDELTALLDDAGFVDVTVCADYREQVAPDAARDWLCFAARARDGRG
jgi:SAM-dependent methyltransferase